MLLDLTKAAAPGFQLCRGSGDRALHFGAISFVTYAMRSSSTMGRAAKRSLGQRNNCHGLRRAGLSTLQHDPLTPSHTASQHLGDATGPIDSVFIGTLIHASRGHAFVLLAYKLVDPTRSQSQHPLFPANHQSSI